MHFYPEFQSRNIGKHMFVLSHYFKSLIELLQILSRMYNTFQN